MSDGLFYLGIIVLFFVLWVATGGPTRPISFAGSYITPITNVDQKQVGYGPQVPKLTTNISAGLGSIGVSDGGAGSDSATTASTDSAYKNDVTISRSYAASTVDPTNKYVHLILTSQDTDTVKISNWRFVSKADNASVVISNSNAALAPDTATVVVTSFPSSTTHDTITLEDSNSKVVSSFTY